VVITRRGFLESSIAIVAGGSVPWPNFGSGVHLFPRIRETKGRLPLGFSTLGCPTWSWLQILDYAVAHGYAAIELRGLQGEMDLSKCPEFSNGRLVGTKQQLAARDLRVTCLGASANMHEMAAAPRAAQLDEGRRFVDLAQALGAPYVRVFGDKYVEGVPREKTIAHVAATLRELGEYAGPRGVTILIESHGDFTDSASLRRILEGADSPAVALLWDAHHTFVSGKETPEETVKQLGRWIRHTHLKDSQPAGSGRRYVLTGTGEVPVRGQIEALARAGYRGFYSFEWEKRWHPEIEEPDVAFAHFARVAKEYLRDAGVRELSAGSAQMDWPSSPRVTGVGVESSE
jgi:sugar phosphate isomerase/epimerase